MKRVTLSSRFPLVLPRGSRERVRLRPGMKFTVLDKGGVISLRKVVRGDMSAERALGATARRHGARLVTADTDFKDLPGAVLIR